MESKRILYSKSGLACMFVFVCLICIRVETSALPSGQGNNERYNGGSVRMSREQRSASVLPGTVSMQTLINASIMVCTEAMAQPYARRVHLNDNHMQALLQDKGGNYVKDYMAATPEEALENFPNMLILTRPLLDSDGDSSFSLTDNLITKQMIINDLNKLTEYLKNASTTRPNDTQPVETSKPLDGAFNPSKTTTITTTTSTLTSENIQPKSESSGAMTTSSASFHSSIPHNNSVSNSSNFVTSKYYTPKDNRINSTTLKISTPNNNRNISTSTTFSVLNENTTPVSKRSSIASTSSLSNLDTTTSATTVAVDTQQTSDSVKGITDQTTPTSSPVDSSPNSVSNSTTTTTTATRTYPGNSYVMGETTTPTVQTSSVTMETKATTIDPDVLKSIQQLQNYVQGTSTWNNISHLGKREIETIWREANTKLHPTTLLGLTTGSTRVKRYADGSFSREEYCQDKGSLTEDRKFVHLCSICAVTTQLPDDMFPRYINEAVCKTGDTDCFTVAGTTHGQCKQTKFSLNMLRRKVGHCNMLIHGGETLVFDNWELFPQLINVACECTINKLSVFSKYAGNNVPIG